MRVGFPHFCDVTEDVKTGEVASENRGKQKDLQAKPKTDETHSVH
jgi:hypothetical protein